MVLRDYLSRYIIINVLYELFGNQMDRCGRAIARWNRFGVKTIIV